MHHSARNQPLLRINRLAGPLLVVLLTVGFYWKLVWSNEYTYLNSPDMARQVLPWYQFEASEWSEGRIPLWDPNHWFGQPLIGQTQPGVVYPLNWILFHLPLKSGWINQKFLHWYYVVIHIMAALFAYALCRELRAGRAASIIGAMLFANGGFVGTNGWPQMLNGAVWAPLVFLFLFRTVRGKRPWTSAALSGLFLGVAWLSGHHQTPTFISLAFVGLWLFFAFRTGRLNYRIAAQALLALAFVALIGALQLLPSQEYGKLAIRWVGMPTPIDWKTKVGYSVQSRYGLDPLALIGLAVPGWHDYSSGFVGVTGLCLALLGMAWRWRTLAARVLTLTGIGGLLFSLANYNLWHGVIYALLPLVDKARAPSMAVVVFNCAVSALAAWGVDSLVRPELQPLRRKAIRAAGYFALLGFAAIFWIQLYKGFPSNGDARPLVTVLAALLLVAVLRWCDAGGLSPVAASTLILMLVMIELGNESTFPWQSRYQENRENFLADHGRDADIAEFLRSRAGMYRVQVDHGQIAHNFGDFHGFHELDGYLASITKIFQNHDVFSLEFRRLAGVRWRVARAQLSPEDREVFSGQRGIKVYETPEVQPRAFLVSKAEKIDQPSLAADWLRDPARDFRRQTFMTADPPELGGCADAGTARILHYTSGYVKIFADARCRAMLVLSDTYYPGWKAKVDGGQTRVYDAYAVFRGVTLEPGSHIVEFRYAPASVLTGALSASAGVLLLVGIWLWERRRPDGGGIPLLDQESETIR